MRKRIIAVVTAAAVLGGGAAYALDPKPDTVIPYDQACKVALESSETVNAKGGISNGHTHYVCADGLRGERGPAGKDGETGPAGPPGPPGAGTPKVDVDSFRTANCHVTVVVTVTVGSASDTDQTRFGGCQKNGGTHR